ncbi:autotransporter adhesin [Megasphaera vaginalis (ex Srinivasan et al. 2021)]|uniref:YadA-like C-terminal domain protein n=1 Tax=Megasphaera vaginalis (ex Srinivasan et al. 2021) TaxID=1111454 RepID=U7UCQ5_9FIRM|nr:autotransporter adhesin [Megasphaera vaginalis (ex Srinivasan et al. 2021)]ERT57197.1 YadA-like C-terminal domain protein [Megasphaera vaginalis (ex Srinivasan et al. 2021)]
MISKGKKSVALCAAVLTALSISCTVVDAAGDPAIPYFSVKSKDQINNDGKGAKGENSVAIGPGSTTKFRDSLSVGTSNTNEGYETVLVGNQNKAYGLKPDLEYAYGATLVGTNNTVMGTSGILAMGSKNIVYEGIAIGAGNKSMGENAVALGHQSSAMYTDSIGIGFGTHGDADAVIAIGRAAKGSALGGVAIGRYAEVHASTGVALGESSVSSRGAGVVGYMPGAVGQTAEEVATYLGKAEEYKSWKDDVEKNKDAYTRAKAWHAAIDAERKAFREINEARIAYAENSTEENKKAITEKYDAWKKASDHRQETDVAMRPDFKTINDLNARYGQIFGKLMSTGGAVSVGNEKEGITRQIINVAAGTKDTDAVNVYQLKAVESKIPQTGAEAQKHTSVAAGTNISVTEEGTNNGGGKNYKVSLAENIDLGQNGSIKAGNTTINKDGLTVQGGPSVTTDGIDAGKNVITNVAAGTKDTDAVNFAQLKAVQEIAAAKTTIEAGDNIKVEAGSAKGSYKISATNTYTTGGTYDAANKKITFTRNDNQTYDVNLADFVGNVTDTRNTIANSDTVTVDDTNKNADGSTNYKLNVKTDGKVAKDDKGIVTGGTVYNETRVANDGNYIKKDNTAGQNLTALDKGISDLVNGMGKLGTDSAVAEDGAYVKKDKTVGENLTAMDKQVQANAGEIGALVNGMGELDSRVNKVGAGSAALAALHPLDFDPEDKWNFAAGYGHYKGSNALAIGAFYRPNENQMVSIGGSFGGGENMINAGVSFKVGEGTSPYAGVSKAQLAQRISRQDEIIRRQDEELAAQKEQIREILAQLEAMKKA